MQLARHHDMVHVVPPAVPLPHSGPSSHFRGVSLLRRTGRWHAQINFDGRQVHLGFFPIETDAAAAYDRAAIIKWVAAATGATHNSPQTPQLNFGLQAYAGELPALGRLSPAWLLGALGEERSRREVMSALAHGFAGAAKTATGAPAPTPPKAIRRPPAAAVTPPARPSQPATPPSGRQKRRKLAVPLHGPCM